MDEALTYFRSLLKHPKYDRIALGFVARTQAKMGAYQDAIATIERAMAIDPKSPELRRRLAAVYEKQHIVSRRIDALKEAARLDGKDAHRDYYELGKIALEVGDYDESERRLNQAITLAPDASQYHYSLGQTLLLRPELGDRLNQAIHHLEEAQRLAPDSANTHDFLSSAYMKAHRWQEAAVSLHRSANIAAQNDVLYFRLNQVYKQLGNEREARRAQEYYRRLRKLEVERDLLTRRVKAQEKDPAARMAMGELYLRLRDYAGARRQFERVVELTPRTGLAHERLVTVYGELDKPEGQLLYLKTFQRLASESTRLAVKQ